MKPYLGFWEKLEKPFFVLAPMANVTDAVFRRVIAKHGRPDVTWTEFVSADGLCHPKGREALLRDLSYTECERPIVAQLFTAYPEKMFEAAKLVAELGFDGVDINMGCPDKNVMKQGAGATLMKDPLLAQAIIRSAQEGIEASGKHIPISVKTRLGYNEDTLEEWLPKLLEMNIAAITVHARTKKEMSKVPARWERIKRAVEIRNGSASWRSTLIIGNGDVTNLEDARKKVEETGADGVMLGRAIFGNPWLFDKNKKNVTVEEKLRAVIEHTKLFEEVWGDTKSFELMKKHYQAYVNNFPEAKELRMQMMECHTAKEIETIVIQFLNHHKEIV
ncbi:MAG: tRNA-dihydrouridine synthase family protein [Candidatus Moranbacteria bacterium]|nr:tRNA-dihydrouridine synthase family protein [Candidatus Moranbacteria bacterium]MDD3964707.1 tRNA-dihydrouridine synthase family protein [Candidatus Moranbacteria bacterium]